MYRYFVVAVYDQILKNRNGEKIMMSQNLTTYLKPTRDAFTNPYIKIKQSTLNSQP